MNQDHCFFDKHTVGLLRINENGSVDHRAPETRNLFVAGIYVLVNKFLPDSTRLYISGH